MENAQKGIEVREAHFPGRSPIDTYGNGGFRFAGMSHLGSLICLPSGIYSWDVTSIDELDAKAFSKIFEEAGDVEILLVGTGTDLVPIKSDLRAKFRNSNISADSMATGAAVRTYNVLVAEDRAVAAAFLAVK
ncbi:MAG: Mth938-like domain-containing protein [Pseudomonadota bacterium]